MITNVTLGLWLRHTQLSMVLMQLGLWLNECVTESHFFFGFRGCDRTWFVCGARDHFSMVRL